jgi:hypothetical protein
LNLLALFTEQPAHWPGWPDAGDGLGSSRLASASVVGAANPIPLERILNGLNMEKFHYLFMAVVLPY